MSKDGWIDRPIPLVALVFGLFPVGGTRTTLLTVGCLAAAAGVVSLTRMVERKKA